MSAGVVYAVLTLEFRKEGRVWLGHCLELGTATDGRSFERVRHELEELTLLHLNGLEDTGQRERVFAERGIPVYHDALPDSITARVPVVQADASSPLIEARVLPLRPHDRAAA